MTAPGGDDRDGFLARWSARKRAEATEPPQEVLPPSEPAPEPPPEDEADPALLAALPRIEDIGPGTDIRGFMQRGVPKALRNAALRRAWVSNPAIANYEDPARDYFWDWNAPGGVPGGGGRLTAEDALRMADRVLNAGPEAPAETTSDPSPEPAAMAAEGPPAEPAARPAAPDPAAPDSAPDSPPAGPRTASVPGTRRHGSAVPT